MVNLLKRMRKHPRSLDFKYGVLSRGSSLTSMRRNDVVHYIYSHGGTVLSAPTRATDYLIVGGEKSKIWKYGQYGTKIRKGLDLREKDEKILIISEEDFMRCIGG